MKLTRRHFVRLSAAASAAVSYPSVWAGGSVEESALGQAIAAVQATYLTPSDKFRTIERGTPPPSELPAAKRREVGLERDTWQLEVVADPKSNSKIERPLAKPLGTALDWAGLMKLAEKKAVRCLKIMTCNNIGSPLGYGLWEGVPLREVIWLAGPKENIRHIYYYGYHNDDPKQIFQSWLPINRVLEDPPGHLPVLLCYKLNGQWLTPKRGGPVRMLVPEAYGFKSVKWLQCVALTNNHLADDTYASGNNDTHSWLKTFARFITTPPKARSGQPIPITGLAQVGISGLAKVQFWWCPQGKTWPSEDPYFTTAAWKDAQILPLPARWYRELPDGELPDMPLQIDPATRQPREWPLRFTLVHWAALLPGLDPGQYELRCRTIDATGCAQPMPRPLAKSGVNAIQSVKLTVAPG